MGMVVGVWNYYFLGGKGGFGLGWGWGWFAGLGVGEVWGVVVIEESMDGWMVGWWREGKGRIVGWLYTVVVSPVTCLWCWDLGPAKERRW